MALLLQRAMATKRALLINARAFRSAYQYRWLSAPTMRIALNMNHSQMNEQFVRIQQDLGQLLSGGPPDQRFDTGDLILAVKRAGGAARANVGMYALLTVPEQNLAGSPSTAALSWSVPVENPFFQGTVPGDGNLAMYIEEAWFYLIGGQPNNQGRVLLKVGTSGQYINGYGRFGAWEPFAAAPSEQQELDFIYAQEPDGTPIDPSAGRGGTPWKPAAGVKAFYMSPSPFTQWTAKVVDAGSLENVVALRVRFKGYYHKARNAEARPVPAPPDLQLQANTRGAVNRHFERWQGTLARLSEMTAMNRKQRLRWLDAEISSDELALYDAGLQYDQGMAGKILATRAAVARHMSAMPGLRSEEARQVCRGWLEGLRRVRAKSSQEQRTQIDLVTAGLASERADLAACGQADPAEMAEVENELRELTQTWKAGLPKRTTQAAPRSVGSVRVDAPVLTMPEEECRRLYRESGNNWIALKSKFSTDPETMWQLWAFRKKIVDETITAFQERYGFEWEAVGSTNLESDYDLSVKTHGRDPETGAVVRDFQVVKLFNDAIMNEYGVQPGTLFDTNLYASAPLASLLTEDSNTPTAKAMKAMAEAGQDVGALMKQRRYMSWQDYTRYSRAIVDGLRAMNKVELSELTLKQFEEADALFQISEATVLENARDLLQGDLAALPDQPEFATRRSEADRGLRWIREAMERMARGDLLEGQTSMLAATLELEHSFPDLYMRTSNFLYVKCLQEVYELEQRAATLEPNTQLETLQGLLARIRTLATDAVFFANEAYLSEGPFLHIVKATQAVLAAASKLSGPERDAYIKENMAKELAKLTANQFLQSFNEQLGDLLKDLIHYANEPSPGIGFYRCSKYVERLLDALLLLGQKMPELDVTVPGASMSAVELKARVAKGLLAARKGQLAFGDNGDTLRGAALQREIEAFSIDEARAMFGVTNLHSLGERFLDLGKNVNTYIRSTVVGKSMYAEAGDSLPYFR